MSDSAEVSETSGGCPSLETFCIRNRFQVNERPIEMCDSAEVNKKRSFLRAEDEGFEPSKGCPLHAFQACALGRYANPPVKPS